MFAYHAGMDQAARTANQERFMSTPRAIAVATNAFGMGINKPDIRLVVHYNLPARSRPTTRRPAGPAATGCSRAA